MRKILSACLALALCAAAPLAALTESTIEATAEPMTAQDLIVTAQVVAREELAIKAPVSGDLLPFTLRAGDAVKAGDALFTVEPKSVYADVDGTIAAVYAAAGDSADGAVNRYGSVLSIEYADRYEIQANVMTGYNSTENRNLYVGTKVYLRSTNEKYFADGIITQVSGRSFTVAVIGGDLVFTQDVKIYRSPDYNNKALLARGSLSAIVPYAVSASGTIISMDVAPGTDVKAGDLLFTYVPDALEPDLRAKPDATTARADADLIIASINVSQGASVQKGQALCTVYPAGAYQLQANVEEGDMVGLRVGDSMSAVFEDLGIPSIQVTVASISPLGTDEEISRYKVYFDFEVPQAVLLGMHATIQP